MKPKSTDVAAKAVALATQKNIFGTRILIKYNDMKCDAFVEKCINDCGGNIGNTNGCNTMARKHCAWLGTIENARAEGKLLKGAGLLINEGNDDNTPAEFKGDGLGDFSHIALYVGEKALYDEDKNGKTRLCNTVHSSETMGRVAGTTTKSGYTHVMLFDCLDYGIDTSGLNVSADAEAILNEEAPQTGMVTNNEGELVEAAAKTYIRVVSGNGNPVRIREQPKRDAIWKKGNEAAVGTRLMVLGERNGYYKIIWNGKARWIDKNFTEPDEG